MNPLRTLLARGVRDDPDTARETRTARVLQLVDRFVYDLGLLIAGESIDLDPYVDAAAAERLHTALRPALGAGAVTRPAFGEYAQVRIEGDLLDPATPVRAIVEFEDRSSRVDGQGRALAGPRRRVRVLLLPDAALTRVVDYRIEVA